jgi:hypothetical protein
MARYIVNVNKLGQKEFRELALARKYANTLPPGTIVEITDSEAGPGQPVTYVMTAGESGVANFDTIPGHPLP